MDSHEGIALWQNSVSKSQTQFDAGRVPCPLFGLPGPPEPTLKKPWGNRELEPIAPTRPWRRYQSEGPTERSQRPQGTRSNLVPPPTSIATCALSTWSTTLPPLLTRLYYHFDLYSIDHSTTLSFLLVWRLSNWCTAVFVGCLPIPQLHHTEHERKLLKSSYESAASNSGVRRGTKKLMRLYKVCLKNFANLVSDLLVAFPKLLTARCAAVSAVHCLRDQMSSTQNGATKLSAHSTHRFLAKHS